MLRRKKTALTKTKLKLKKPDEQTAAIAEIEAILNMEEQVESRKLKIKSNNAKELKNKAPVIFKESGKTEECAARSEFKNEPEQPISKKTNVLLVRRDEARSPYLVNLKKIWEERQKQTAKSSPMEDLKKLPNLIKSLPAQRKEVIKTISSYPRAIVTPVGVLWQGLASVKGASAGSAAYLTGFYNKHRAILDEILIFNILTLAGFSVWRAFKALTKILFSVSRFVGKNLAAGARILRRSFIANKSINFIKIFLAAASQASAFCGTKIWRAPKATKKLFLIFSESAVNALKSVNSGAREILAVAEKTAKNKAGSFKDKQNKIISGWIDFFQKRENWPALKFLPPLTWQRQLLGFAIFAVILIFPLKLLGYLDIFQNVRGRVLGESEEAAGNLRQALSAGGQLNFTGAAGYFSDAADNFSQAQSTLLKYSDLIKVANILPNKQIKLAAAGQALIASGRRASKIGEYLSLSLDSLQLGKESAAPLTERIRFFSEYCRQALGEMDAFEQEIKSIDLAAVASLDMEGKGQIAEQLQTLQERVGLIKTGLSELTALSEILPVFLGEKMDARYLLIFQNNAEMRASGGFIGSFALVDFRRGEIKKLEVPGGGSYDLQGGLHKRVASPEPLHLINSLWEFQDANWWPDWPASAKKIAWFFENGWGSTVDGVIAIDPTFFEELLAVVGPVDLSREYGAVIGSENFYDIVQAQAERKDTNKPKMIIRDLADKILAELPARLTENNFFALLKTAERAITEKHLLLNFNNEELQRFVDQAGWSGNLKDTDCDYLAVINTNIAGGKSDRKIKQKIEHLAEVTPDGSIIDTVIITREHAGVRGEPFSGVRNVNYLRVYAPLGSELMETSGWSAPEKIYFDPPAAGAEIDPDVYVVENIAKTDEISGVKIYNEFNKTVFANWTQVDPGQTATVRLKYKLPFKLNKIQDRGIIKKDDIITYSLLAQKQAGSVATDFTSILKLPANMEIVWAQPEEIRGASGWQVASDLKRDSFWGVLINKK